MRLIFCILSTLLLTYCFAWVFGHIPFSDGAAYALDKICAFFGIYGVETEEDFYMLVTLFLSLVAAALIVWRIAAFIQRKIPHVK